MIFDIKPLRRAVGAVLCAALLTAAPIGTLSLPVSALSDEDGANGTALSLPDVKSTDWFAEDVARLAADGIISGYPDGLFHPEREITTAEFVKLLICALGASRSVEALLFPEHWACNYLTAAYERGFITDADLEGGFSPDAPITRAAMTKITVLALGIETARIDDPFTDISDIYASTAYNEYLLRGYVMPDGSRIYNGSGNAARSEAAAIIVRIIEYSLDSYAYKRDAILENASQNILTEEFELIDLFYTVNRELMSEFTFRTNAGTRLLRDSYERSNLLNLEFFYSSSASIKNLYGDFYTVKLKYKPDVETVAALRSSAEEKAREIVSLIITESMSDTDKVKAIHDYLILNCEYDYDNYIAETIPYESRIPYGVLVNKRAVCQGYCSAFALLCEYAGVRALIAAGNAPNSSENHAWNMVLLDGRILYVDVTHDDPIPDRMGAVSYRYYLLTESEMSSYGYIWDKFASNLKYFY